MNDDDGLNFFRGLLNALIIECIVLGIALYVFVRL